MEVLVLQYNMQTVSPQEGMSYLMHDELSDQVELASDLEWLLLNDRAKADELLMHLVVDYGAGLNLLMQSLFADPSTVEEAMVETLVQIVLQRDRYQTDQAVKVWLYSFALDTAWRLRRRWKWGMIARNPKEHNTWPSFNQMDGIPGWMEYLPEQTRLVTVLQRYIGLEQNEIAQVLGTPVFSIVQTLAVVDRIFPPESSQHKLKLNTSFQQHLLEVTLPSAMENQPEGKLSRNLLEISWVIGAVCIIALLTRIYDLVNPDLVRQAVEFSFLTPLPTLTREPMPTATSLPWLDMSDSPEEIALRYWQRWLHVDTIWIDYLIMLGGAQGGINGYSLSRVELAWDMQTGNRMILVGPPEGPPAYGLYSNNNNTYEFPIRYGRLAETTIINNSRPSYWFYLADLALNLQINNFDGNWTFKPVGDGTLLGRESLVVEVINADGLLENRTYFDSVTAIPLIQQRFRPKGESDYLVLYMIVNNISVDEPIPVEHFSIENSRPVQFRTTDDWIDNPVIEANLSRWKKIFTDQAASDDHKNLHKLLNYQVFAIPHQQGIKYSTGVIADNVLIGEYPMGYPWSVKCERSQDGRRVAFIEDRRFEFGTLIPSQVLHWFSLDNPGVLQTPLPGADATRFTFSPDSHFLAVHASNEVSIIDLESGQVTFLLDVPAVDRLVFSDDGKYLGVHGPTLATRTTSIWIIDPQNRDVVDAISFGLDQDWKLQRALIFNNWHVDFDEPVYFGLENCR